MPIQIGQLPGHDFDEPLGLLSDCHRRIEHFLRVLHAVTTDAQGGPLTAPNRTALQGALEYFAVAAPKHTADEEASLFPRLRGAGDPAAAEALALVDRLQRDHEEADTHHAAVDVLVRQWLEDGALATARTAELQERLARLRTLYERHIRLEDQELFPAAARLLDAEQLRAIGREMAERRNLRPARVPRPG